MCMGARGSGPQVTSKKSYGVPRECKRVVRYYLHGRIVLLVCRRVSLKDGGCQQVGHQRGRHSEKVDLHLHQWVASLAWRLRRYPDAIPQPSLSNVPFLDLQLVPDRRSGVSTVRPRDLGGEVRRRGHLLIFSKWPRPLRFLCSPRKWPQLLLLPKS